MIMVGDIVVHARSGKSCVVVQIRDGAVIANDPVLGAYDFDLVPLGERGAAHVFAPADQLVKIP